MIARGKRGVVPFQIKRKLLYEAYMVLERVHKFSDVDMTINDIQKGLEQRGFLCQEKSALLKNALYKAHTM